MRKSKPKRQPAAAFGFRAEQFVVATGDPAGFEVEAGTDPRKIDHVWITIHAGQIGRLRIDINTRSLKHAADGFDPRMRLAVIAETWTDLPQTGVFPATTLDYAELERLRPILYEEIERRELERQLRSKADRAVRIQAWGAFYLRDQVGIHQVHSRRASCSVRSDYVGRDGAVRFYFPDKTAEMLLFKYCGQV